MSERTVHGPLSLSFRAISAHVGLTSPTLTKTSCLAYALIMWTIYFYNHLQLCQLRLEFKIFPTKNSGNKSHCIS